MIVKKNAGGHSKGFRRYSRTSIYGRTKGLEKFVLYKEASIYQGFFNGIPLLLLSSGKENLSLY